MSPFFLKVRTAKNFKVVDPVVDKPCRTEKSDSSTQQPAASESKTSGAQVAKAASAPHLPIDVGLPICTSPGKKGTPRADQDAARNAAQLAAWFESISDNEVGFRTGLTAVTALVVGNYLVVANVSYSPAVLCRGGRAIELTKVHTAARSTERRRIGKAGGKLEWTNLGVLTRSFRDFNHKNNTKLSEREQFMVFWPYVSVQKLSKHDNFLVLASDGKAGTSSQRRASADECRSCSNNRKSCRCPRFVREFAMMP